MLKSLHTKKNLQPKSKVQSSKKSSEMVKLKMDDVPAIVNVVAILGLEFVCFLAYEFGDLVQAFPYRPELAYSCILRVLEDLA